MQLVSGERDSLHEGDHCVACFRVRQSLNPRERLPRAEIQTVAKRCGADPGVAPGPTHIEDRDDLYLGAVCQSGSDPRQFGVTKYVGQKLVIAPVVAVGGREPAPMPSAKQPIGECPECIATSGAVLSRYHRSFRHRHPI